MKFAFTVERADNTDLIRGYQPGELRVREHRIEHSVILSGSDIVFDWPPQRVEQLTAEHLNAVLQLRPEVILLGTGMRQHFPGTEVLEPARRAGVGVEVMDTAAACRTYNILLQDGRRVAAALIIEK